MFLIENQSFLVHKIFEKKKKGMLLLAKISALKITDLALHRNFVAEINPTSKNREDGKKFNLLKFINILN